MTGPAGTDTFYLGMFGGRMMEQHAEDLGVEVCLLDGGREELSSRDLHKYSINK